MPMVSSSCDMRGMPRVVMLSTWVSPRWKSPDPWAVGTTPTSAVTGRRSLTPRPSMRTPSSTMRRRTVFLVRALTASRISFSRPSNSAARVREIWAVASSRAALRSALLTMLVALETTSAPTSSTRAKTSWP